MKKSVDLILNGVQHNLACYARHNQPFPEGAVLLSSSAAIDLTDAISTYLVDSTTNTLHAPLRIWVDMKVDLGIDTTLPSYGEPNCKTASNLIKNRSQLNFSDQFTKYELTYMGNKANASLQSIIIIVDNENKQKTIVFSCPYLLDLLYAANVSTTF